MPEEEVRLTRTAQGGLKTIVSPNNTEFICFTSSHGMFYVHNTFYSLPFCVCLSVALLLVCLYF